MHFRQTNLNIVKKCLQRKFSHRIIFMNIYIFDFTSRKLCKGNTSISVVVNLINVWCTIATVALRTFTCILFRTVRGLYYT